MRTTIITLLLALATTVATAQERVFQTIYKMSAKTANDPQESAETRQVAQFRVDAVTYLNTQTLTLLTDSANTPTGEQAAHLSAQLDSMAFFMYDYVDLYQKEYHRARGEKAKQRITRIFREVSLTYPLFNDPDREYVLAYVNSDDTLTPFSFDTDWVKASAIVRERLRE